MHALRAFHPVRNPGTLSSLSAPSALSLIFTLLSSSPLSSHLSTPILSLLFLLSLLSVLFTLLFYPLPSLSKSKDSEES